LHSTIKIGPSRETSELQDTSKSKFLCIKF